MNTSQLQCCIDCDPLLRRHILGVYAADKLPNIFPFYPCGFIANTDEHKSPGRHWIAFYLPKQGRVECFDSYGQSPELYNSWISSWLQKHFTYVIWNTSPIQSDFSNVCGLYSLYFLRERLIGQTLRDVVETFHPTNLRHNDIFIFNLFQRLFPHCVHKKCLLNQGCTKRMFTLNIY